MDVGLKRKITLITVVLVTLFTGLWLFNHSFMELTIDAANGSTAVTIKDQKSHTSTTLNSESPKIKRLIGRGNYEVLVSNKEKSYITVIKTSGFLRKTTIAATLFPEKQRKFIGDNPSSCAYLVTTILQSLACGDKLEKMQIHVPSTALVPTYITKIPTPSINGFLEDIINTREGAIVLIKGGGNGSEQDAKHFAFNINGDGTIYNGVALGDLPGTVSYEYLAYQDGFIAYDKINKNAAYFQTRLSPPKKVDIPKPKNDTLGLEAVRVLGNSMMFVYSDTPFGGYLGEFMSSETSEKVQPDSTQRAGKKTKAISEVVLVNGSDMRRLSLDITPSDITYCATNKMCVLQNGILTVYEVSGNEKVRLFELSGILGINSGASGFRVVKKEGVVNLDLTKQQGFLEYSLADYTYCGIKTTSNGYLVCVVNNKGERAALYLDPTAPNSDSIDKKVADLLKLPEIKSISAYNYTIFISPNLGEIIYDQQQQINTYDPAVIKAVNAKINQEINRLGISRSTYKIVNPFDTQ